MFQKTVLGNGLRIVTETISGTKAVTVLVLVGAGSRYEKQEIRGISHFLEHMFFKGAKKYKNTKEVSEAVDRVGGEFNAFTGKEYAGYYVKVASGSREIAFEVLSDMLINSRFDQAEIEKERGVILEEYNMYQDTPMYQIGWDFEGLLFGNQPLGWDQIGTKELISSVTHDGFVQYKNELYTPDNTVIAVAGNIEHEDVMELVKKYFGMAKTEKKYGFRAWKKMKGARISIRKKKTEQAHLAIGFLGYPETHKDHFVKKILAVILGGNMSSRMFLNVREAKGLSYYIHTSTDNYTDAGAIVTNSGVDLKRVDEAILGIIEEYRKVCEEDVGEEELEKAKSYLKGKLVLGLEDSEEFAHLIGKYELLHGKVMTLEEIFKAVDKVKVADVRRVAEDLLQPKKMKMALIGPFGKEEKAKFEGMMG